MILTSLKIAGFGRLVDRRFDFAPGLNIVYGPNESGKSTLANAIVATLYGAERKKEAWRPWNAGRFGTTLVYQLAGGAQIEVQRNFERDGKGLRIYDRDGKEISGKIGGHKIVPGEAHLGIPLEVFLNAAGMKQQALAIGEGKASGSTATHLARALDGGPRDDAALGAIARLDDALRTCVGTERAHKHAPLRALRTRAQSERAEADAARARRAELDDLRDRFERARHDCERLTTAAAEIERRSRSLRAGSIAKRLANLRDFRAELADLGAAQAAYADVAGFSPGAEREVEEAFSAWESAQTAATTAEQDAALDALSEQERAALAARRLDAGTIDEPTYDRLVAADRACATRSAAAAARRETAATASALGAVRANAILVTAIVMLCAATGFAVARDWTWTGAAALIALAGFLAALARVRTTRLRARSAARIERNAARAGDDDAAVLAAVLEPLQIDSFAQLVARRAEYHKLLSRVRAAERTAERAQTARRAADHAAARFDALVGDLLPDADGNRVARRAAVRHAAMRRRERDGIEAHLNALELRRSTILGDDDEAALETELSELRRHGFDAPDEGPGALRAVAAERLAIAENLRAARDAAARHSGEIAILQAQIPDLAELDERLALTQAEIARIEAFERAVTLAKTTIETRTHEVHAAFARRLETFAAGTIGTITGGRYGEIFVDPTTLAIRVRIPETQAIKELDALSAGTRDQAYLAVRLAMARVFAHGLEIPPLLLDDPFAYWDAVRIDRCLPVVELAAHEGQAIVFTSSSELADAARARGANRIDLSEPAQIESAAAGGSDRSTAMRI